MINIKIKGNAEEIAEATVKPEALEVEFTKKDEDVCRYLANQAFDFLKDTYEVNSKPDIFDDYMSVMMDMPQERKYLIPCMVCILLSDNDCFELSALIESTVLKSEEAVLAFANHIISIGIACLWLDEDDEEEMYEECDFYE